MSPATYKIQAPNTPYIRPIMPVPIIVTNSNVTAITGLQIGENRRLRDHKFSELHNCNLLES